MDTELLKERILDLTEERLFRLGYRHMSVDELAQAAGISKRTLYQLFPSKREMVAQALERFIARMKEAVQECIRENENPVDRLRAIITFISQELSRPERSFFEDLQRNLPDIWSKFEEMRRSVILDLESTISEGIEQGSIREDLNPQVVVRALLGALNAVGTPEVLAQSPFSALEAFQNIWTVFLQGMLAEGAR